MAVGGAVADKTVIWEWKDDYHNWMSYSQQVADFIEQVYQNKTPSDVRLDQADPRMHDYTVNVQSMYQMRGITKRKRSIRRTEVPVCHSLWEWEEFGQWTSYSARETKLLEDAYNSNAQVCQLSPKYKVDLVRMQQENNITGYRRRVKRTSKGGAQTTMNNGFSPYNTNSRQQRPSKSSDIFTNQHSSNWTSAKAQFASNSTNFDPQSHSVYLPTASRIAKNLHSRTAKVSDVDDGTLLESLYPVGASGSQNSVDADGSWDDATAGGVHSAEGESAEPSGDKRETDETGSSHHVMSLSDPRVFKYLKDVDNLLVTHLFTYQPSDKDEDDKDVCPICLLDFDELFSNFDPDNAEIPSNLAVTLECKHPVHLDCAKEIFKNNNKQYLSCPICKRVFGGVLTGTQPSGGSMSVQRQSFSCAGYESYPTFEITYNFSPGLQGPEHPNPGRPYHLSGFPRVAYLPASEEGTLLVKMLRVAFERRLVFTIGTSHTTGMPDSVVWGGVHHKTSPSGGSHGFPDPTHLQCLKEELNKLHVFETDVSEKTE